MQPDPAVERPLWNPYLAGIALGLLVLLSYLIMGFGLGSSSAPTRLAIAMAHGVSPGWVEGNGYLGEYVAGGANPLDDWMVFEVIGTFLGGLVGAYSAGRLRSGVMVRGAGVSLGSRVGSALAGGVILGFAARLARGCTSGQALTGGSVLSVGAWVFMLAVFAGAYMTAPLIRRHWQ